MHSSFLRWRRRSRPPTFLWLDGFELCPSPQAYWPDRDNDTYGDDNYSFVGCVQPPGFFPVDPGDCDDLNPGINPSAVEQCNGIDDNCDGQVDEGNPGGGQTCDTGLPGACSAGTTVCQDGWFVCVPDNPSCP